MFAFYIQELLVKNCVGYIDLLFPKFLISMPQFVIMSHIRAKLIYVHTYVRIVHI